MAASILCRKAPGSIFIEAIKMAIVLLGIDDTDNAENPGTGRLARRLGEELVQRGARPMGITRHELLQDPRIPCTRHNKAACIQIEWGGALSELEFMVDLVRQSAATGSDPGLCIAAADTVPPALIEWGIRATQELLTQDAAGELAAANKIFLRPLGGSGDGIIGALAAVGLRAGGNHGRFIDLPGLRTLGESARADELDRMGIEVDHVSPNEPIPASAAYKTMNWVRPRLSQGRPVWPVEWSDNEHAWIAVDRQKPHPME
jgi:hypothetical protein